MILSCYSAFLFEISGLQILSRLRFLVLLLKVNIELLEFVFITLEIIPFNDFESNLYLVSGIFAKDAKS